MATEIQMRAIEKARDHLQALVDDANAGFDLDDGIIIVCEPPPPASNYRATVKERQDGEPCFVELELHKDAGLQGKQTIVFDMPDETTVAYARRVADELNNLGARLVVRNS
jgi:hypothetical protein